MKKPQNKPLRINIIWNKSILNEYIYKNREEIAIISTDPTIFPTYYYVIALLLGIFPYFLLKWLILSRRKENLIFIDNKMLPENFPMFQPTQDGEYVINVHKSMAGKISVGNKIYDIVEYIQKYGKVEGDVYKLKINEEFWGIVVFEKMGIFFQFPKVEEAKEKKSLMAIITHSSLLLGLGLLSLFIEAFILVASFVLYDPYKQEVSMEAPQRTVKIMMDKAEKADEIVIEEKTDGKDESVGKKAGGEEGKFGDPNKTGKSIVPLRDGALTKKIQNLGIHRALSTSMIGNTSLSKIFGTGGGFEADVSTAMSGEGDVLRIGHGSWGMGFKGTGTGGGGSGVGRIHGLGNIDTGGGTGLRANIGGKQMRKVTGQMRTSGPLVGDFCSKQNIMTVVGTHTGGIRWCYEDQLQRDHKLAGKITMQWRIGLDGRVKSAWATDNSMNNAEVTNCILRQIRRLNFEKPKGGECIVTFPFIFQGAL